MRGLRIWLVATLSTSVAASAPATRAPSTGALPAAMPNAPTSAVPAWAGVEFARTSNATILHVVRSSPAAKAGLLSGDEWLAIDGAATKTAGDVKRAISHKRPADTVTARIRRGGKELSLAILLGSAPTPEALLGMETVGIAAPSWAKAQAIGGAPKSVEELRGKVLLVTFGAPWCGACRAAEPWLSDLQKRKAAEGVVVVAIESEQADALAERASRYRFSHHVLSDPSESSFSNYRVRMLPTMFVVDRAGIVRHSSIGLSPDAVEAELDRALGT